MRRVGGGAEHRLTRIVLARRPELEARLARPELSALRRAVAFQTRLEAIAEPEVGADIRHRLAVAGHEAPDKLFSAQAVEIVARASVGLARVVKILCRAALKIAEAAGQSTISEVSDEPIDAAIQACLVQAQNCLAAQALSLLPESRIAGAVPAGPGPPRLGAPWPMVIETQAAAARVARTGAAAYRIPPPRLRRAALGLLAGLILGLAVVTLYAARLETPEAVWPDLLVSSTDNKAQAREAVTAVLGPELPVEVEALLGEPAVLVPKAPSQAAAIARAPRGAHDPQQGRAGAASPGRRRQAWKTAAEIDLLARKTGRRLELRGAAEGTAPPRAAARSLDAAARWCACQVESTRPSESAATLVKPFIYQTRVSRVVMLAQRMSQSPSPVLPLEPVVLRASSYICHSTFSPLPAARHRMSGQPSGLQSPGGTPGP
jgi:hypothetical protein